MSDKKQRMLDTPFGGLHAILVADFYQLKCVQYKMCSRALHFSLKGKHLWEQLGNQYKEITENCRFNNA